MKLDPLKFNPFRSKPLEQDPGNGDLATYDESILQQSRFWMRTVTWTMIGTTVFGIAWLALARTEEIVVAPGRLEPIGSVQDIQMPVGGCGRSNLGGRGRHRESWPGVDEAGCGSQ